MTVAKSDVVLGTRNHGKIAELRSLLKGMPLRVLSFLDFPDLPVIDEDGKSFRQNAEKKAKAIAKAVGRIAIADDSGLEVDWLNGAPGIWSARFAGEGATDRDNARKLLKLLDGVPWEKRCGRFVCVICAADPKGKTVSAEGVCRGKVSFEMRGTHGFGYDPVFVPNGYRTTMAEMDAALKNRISHRADAMNKFREVFREFIELYKR
ncbi:MAG: XTP/dITP diphosphatase [bacterium]